jgi:hypothetical protein
MLVRAARISASLALLAPLSLGVIALGGLALGCGAATPAANAPAHGETAVVNLDAPAASASASAKPAAPPETGDKRYGIKGPADNADPHIARQAALREAAEFGQIGLLNATGGVVGGVVGGVLGGTDTLHLTALGGGGTGFGMIGTLGSGSGYGGSSGYVSVPGTAINVLNGVVIEFHDAVALGLALEPAVRGLRDHVYGLRNCYSEALAKRSGLTGTVRVRFVAKEDGRVAYVASSSADLTNVALLKCVEKDLTGMYVGVPAAGSYGVAEAEISFRPAPPK